MKFVFLTYTVVTTIKHRCIVIICALLAHLFLVWCVFYGMSRGSPSIALAVEHAPNYDRGGTYSSELASSSNTEMDKDVFSTRTWTTTANRKEELVPTTNTPKKSEFQATSPPVIPFMGDYNCTDKTCSEFLTEEDWKKSECPLYAAANIKLVRFPGSCHFMNGTNRSPVLLKSFPGSGNTWVRGLLEQVTGICTGSFECDRVLKRGGFSGENIQSGSVLVTKVHGHPWVSGCSVPYMNWFMYNYAQGTLGPWTTPE